MGTLAGAGWDWHWTGGLDLENGWKWAVRDLDIHLPNDSFFGRGELWGFLLEIAMETGDPGHSFPVQDVTRCQEGPSGATLNVFKRRRGRHRDIGWHSVFLINKHSWKQDHHAHFISNVLWGCTYLLRRDLFFVLHALQERGNWKNTHIYREATVLYSLPLKQAMRSDFYLKHLCTNDVHPTTQFMSYNTHVKKKKNQTV